MRELGRFPYVGKVKYEPSRSFARLRMAAALTRRTINGLKRRIPGFSLLKHVCQGLREIAFRFSLLIDSNTRSSSAGAADI